MDDKDEVLFRQIHPSFVIDGRPSSQPFQPTPKDEGLLSVDRSSVTRAAEAHALYIGDGNQSVAVYGLTVAEFEDQQIKCAPDPIAAAPGKSENAAHAVADYNPHNANQQKIKAKRLKQKALARGCLYP